VWLEDWIRARLEAAGEDPGLPHFALMALVSMLEYVVPPVPGDVVVLAGAVLVGAKHWPLAGVVLSVNLGSLAGFSLDYLFGRWVGARDARWRERYPRWRRLGPALDRVEASFRRWGAAYIALNRFVPALRAVFFVAAGMAGLPYWKVVLWGLVSAVAWNALIFAVGVWVGYRWETLVELGRTYGIVVFAAAGVVALVLVVRWRMRR
jgi:membrane-associated protein